MALSQRAVTYAMIVPLIVDSTTVEGTPMFLDCGFPRFLSRDSLNFLMVL